MPYQFPDSTWILTAEQVVEVSAFDVADRGGGGKATDGRKSLKEDFTCKLWKAGEMSWGLNNIKG